MNPIVEKLALQAGGSHYPEVGGKTLEYFAKLVVLECANELMKWESEPFPLDPKHAAKIVKEHFGVEE